EPESPCRADRFLRPSRPGIDRIRSRQQEEPLLYFAPQDAALAAEPQVAEETSDRKREPAIPAGARIRTLTPIRVRIPPASPASAELLPQAFPWAWEQKRWRRISPKESSKPPQRAFRRPQPKPVLQRYEILRHAQAMLRTTERREAS